MLVVTITITVLSMSRVRTSYGFLNTRNQFASSVPKRLRHQHAASLDPSSLTFTVADFPTSATQSAALNFEALMASMYSTGVAHGHSNPWFGPPDPYLEAGRSIAPLQSAVQIPSESVSTSLPQSVQDMINKGYSVIDSATIKDEWQLPGFVPSSKVFSSHETSSMSPAHLESFLFQAEWASSFVKVFDKLALASFVYCSVEFFFLRRNVDLYKSEIEQESPASLWADVLATWAVRFIAMGFFALLTLAIFL